MVTGAGGSIGSELCRQICRYEPAALLLVDHGENNLFEIHRELTHSCPEMKLVPLVGDVTDEPRMRKIFEAHRPRMVLHAAAYKHVPMMEWNPGEAIKNNVLGTRTVADLSSEYGVREFVLISTDKAVNPTSIMGATKRAAELYVQALTEKSETRFVAVRFGNVLGSAGSVGADLQGADRRRWAGHRHPPGHAALLHDDPRGDPARHPGGDHGQRRRDLHPRHG